MFLYSFDARTGRADRENPMAIQARLALAIIAWTAVSLLQSPAVIGQTQQQIDWCDFKGNPTPDLRIAGCTAVIQSGKNTGVSLSLAFAYRGVAYSHKKDYAAAIADYTESIRLNPNDAVNYQRRGHAYMDIKNSDRAFADYTQMIRIEPTAYNYGIRCFNNAIVGRLQQALADCNEAIRINPKSVRSSRGLVYLKLGKFDQAIADYDAALKNENPKSAFSLYGRGFANLKIGKSSAGNTDIMAAKAIQANIAEKYAGWGVH